MTKSKKDTARASYKLIFEQILKAEGVDGRHYKDALKVLLRLFSHFSEPCLDKDITYEIVKAKKDKFEIHHPHEIANLADDLMQNGVKRLDEVMSMAEKKIIKSCKAHAMIIKRSTKK